MLDINEWEKAIISDIALAIYVPPSTKRTIHTDRPYHGLIWNELGSDRDYYFSNGMVMHTQGHQLFYLPKGSSYTVKGDGKKAESSCYAINFAAELSTAPFSMSFRNHEQIEKLFKTATTIWKRQEAFCDLSIRKILYEIILLAAKEQQKKYTPTSTNLLIAPALDMIHSDFTRNNISVTELAERCGISEAYLRRIFMNKYGISPKEYIINMRITYAKQLLTLEEIHISTVASMCGYAEPTHFSREFTRRVGISPSNFKYKTTDV